MFEQEVNSLLNSLGWYELPTRLGVLSPGCSAFDATEELLLIRGVTPEYYYGRPERAEDGSIIYKYGISRCLTVYSTSTRSQINVNYAPLPVLLSIPGIDLETAERIIANRPFQNTGEISDAIPGSLTTESLQYFSTQLTDIYTLNIAAFPVTQK